MELFGDTKDFIRSRWFHMLERISPSKIEDPHDIPIVINSFNRLTTLRRLTASLEERGLTNIHILDNRSTYPPLLEWYEKEGSRYDIIRLPKNFGFKALWKYRPTRKRFCGDYYIYTDADVELDPSCPADVVARMFDLLKNRYPYAFKIGPSIRIDDLPDCYKLKDEVLAWESRFFTRPAGDGLYRATIDTTFALYRPRIGLSRRPSLEAYRMAAPYCIRHLPWYEDSANVTDEDRYYKEHCLHITSWNNK